MRTYYPKTFDVVGYDFQAARYCVTHAAAQVIGHPPTSEWTADTPEQLMDRMAWIKGINRMDERTFDSDDFPKVIFRDQATTDDTCTTCGEELT